jgi:hypothetical protein
MLKETSADIEKVIEPQRRKARKDEEKEDLEKEFCAAACFF